LAALESNFRRDQGGSFRKNRKLKLRHAHSAAIPRCHSQTKLGSTQFPISSRK
jgi:hypothetical protein